MLVSEIVKIRAISQGKGDDLAYQELLKSEIIAFNSLLIKQNYEKTGFYQQLYVQTIDDIPLISVSVDDCDDLHNRVLRTEKPLPKPLVLNDSQPFLSVSNSVKGKQRRSISFLTSEELEYVQYRKFTKDNVYYTYDNQYIYIHGTNLLEKISLRSLFDNPLQVLIFTNNCKCKHDSPCINDNDLEIESITEYNSALILSSFGSNENKE